MQKIVIFDMDGTLLDSQKDITVSINYIRKLHYNLQPLSEEFVVEAINKDVRNLAKLFYGTEKYEESDRVVFEEHYAAQCVQNPYLYDGVGELLESLYGKGMKLGVATNAPTQFALRMLQHLGVDCLFGLIVGADQVSMSKPDPQMLYKILDHFNYNPSTDKAWMVGDNSKDMLSASNANIDAVFATWGFSPRSEHHTTIHSPKELLEIVI